jgi:2-hydroxy-3-keto-5-methylthiopentenyl-1-phosphate phosphatase
MVLHRPPVKRPREFLRFVRKPATMAGRGSQEAKRATFMDVLDDARFPGHSLLVTDFDGTITRHDFYKLAAESLLPADLPDYWAAYRARRITHFHALQAIFASIRADLATVRALVDRMELDPDLPLALTQLRLAGWSVAVASAGCDWYIRMLLDQAGVDLPVWANPGQFVPGRGLLMELPPEGPFFSSNMGVDKAALVREGLARGKRVAFAGDGYPDLDAARLVPAELRFARGDLARVLGKVDLGFQKYDRWSEIAEGLCATKPMPTHSDRAGYKA